MKYDCTAQVAVVITNLIAKLFGQRFNRGHIIFKCVGVLPIWLMQLCSDDSNMIVL